MRRRTGGEDGSGTEMRASVTIAGEYFVASPDRPLVFGRADSDGVVGLHADDMGISAIAGSLELAWGVWWVINQSTKRPLLLEQAADAAAGQVDSNEATGQPGRGGRAPRPSARVRVTRGKVGSAFGYSGTECPSWDSVGV
jgi:hypothetical protein